MTETIEIGDPPAVDPSICKGCGLPLDAHLEPEQARRINVEYQRKRVGPKAYYRPATDCHLHSGKSKKFLRAAEEAAQAKLRALEEGDEA